MNDVVFVKKIDCALHFAHNWLGAFLVQSHDMIEMIKELAFH